MKTPPERLCAAMTGRLTGRHRFLLRLHRRQVDSIADALADIDAEVARELGPFRDAVRLLRSIPGVSDLSAQAIVAEIGTDMGRFPTAGNLVSWAGLCPRNDGSAGKRRSTRLRTGGPWLKITLVQCAWAASNRRNSYLRAQFHHLRQKRGPKQAVCAVAASILTAAWHMLTNGTPWHDVGPDHFHRSRHNTSPSKSPSSASPAHPPPNGGSFCLERIAFACAHATRSSLCRVAGFGVCGDSASTHPALGHPQGYRIRPVPNAASSFSRELITWQPQPVPACGGAAAACARRPWSGSGAWRRGRSACCSGTRTRRDGGARASGRSDGRSP